jgi:hypothetical protein
VSRRSDKSWSMCLSASTVAGSWPFPPPPSPWPSPAGRSRSSCARDPIPKDDPALPRRFSIIADGIPRAFAACSSASARADHLIPLRSLFAPRAGVAKTTPSPHECMGRDRTSSGDSVRTPPRGPLHQFSGSTVHSQLPCRNRTAFGPAVPTAWVTFRPRGFSPPRRFSPAERYEHCCSS